MTPGHRMWCQSGKFQYQSTQYWPKRLCCRDNKFQYSLRVISLCRLTEGFLSRTTLLAPLFWFVSRKICRNPDNLNSKRMRCSGNMIGQRICKWQGRPQQDIPAGAIDAVHTRRAHFNVWRSLCCRELGQRRFQGYLQGCHCYLIMSRLAAG